MGKGGAASRPVLVAPTAVDSTSPYRWFSSDPRAGLKAFVRADTRALSEGYNLSSPERHWLGLRAALEDMLASNGHCYVAKKALFAKASRVLGASVEELNVAFDTLVKSRFIQSDDKGWLTSGWMNSAEELLATRLAGLLSGAPSDISSVSVAKKTGGDIDLSEEQEKALKQALSSRVVIITGGPGTGKTTLVRALVEQLMAGNVSCTLLSPTGKAARRLASATGRKASTIHRWLNGRFAPGVSRAQAVIVDEVSMVDTELAARLLDALGANDRLVLIGDEDQLMAVGPGAVLHDLIASGLVPVVRLTHVFRQAEASAIVRNAHRIKKGERPIHGGDCTVIVKDDPLEIAGLVRDIALRTNAIVLSPQKATPVGVLELGRIIQAERNPPSPSKVELRRGDTIFRQGDPVIFLKNDYDRDVSNGQDGTVRGLIAPSKGRGAILVVETDDVPSRQVRCEGSQLDEVTLAYALTIHKSQGSEYDHVVVPCVVEHAGMLARNLIYTALTRAKKHAYIIAQPAALTLALRPPRGGPRRTRLQARLKEALASAQAVNA